MVIITSLGGLPRFLRVLATSPAPDDVMRTLIAGPLAPYGAVAARFWLLDGEDLVHGGGFGYTDEETERYSVLTPQVPFTMWTAVRTGELVVTSPDTPRGAALDLVDQDFREAMVRRNSTVSVVRAPLQVAGSAVGAMGVAFTQAWPGDESATALMRALASAVALWATTPESGAGRAVAATRAGARALDLSFTDRELDILRLVEARMPTGIIARTIHVSESTVKRELRDVMRALGTNDRLEAAARARALGLLD